MVNKIAEKNANLHQHQSKANQPFFKKDRQSTFFSNTPTAIQTKPFFKTSRAPAKKSLLQTKPVMGQPNDRYEKEADAMADRVVKSLQTTSPATAIQRKCDECEKEEKVQQRHLPLTAQLNSSKGMGNALPHHTKAQMEHSFGADFSSVRIHTHEKAVQMSRQLHAQAFTYGSDIYFNKGKYNPDASAGKHLLAHELTHVVQQNRSRELKPKLIQKSVGDGHDLSSEQFAGNPTLEAVFDNEKLLRNGSNGVGVGKLQEALLFLGFRLANFGADSKFGSETQHAVMEYQVSRGLVVDGLVGPLTIGMLDSELGSPSTGKENLTGIEAPEEIEAGETVTATAKSISGVAEPPVTWKLLQGPPGTKVMDTPSPTTSVVSPSEGVITIAAMKSPPVTKKLKVSESAPKVCKYTFAELDASKASGGKAAVIQGSRSRLLLWFDFESGKSTIRPNHTDAVNKLIQIDKLDQTVPSSKISFIFGFSDCVGKETKNSQIRLDRANSLKTEFLNSGALTKNIGATFPSPSGSELGNNFTPEGRARNRSALVVSEPVKPPKPEKIKIEDIIDRLKKVATTIKVEAQRKRLLCLLDMMLDTSKDDHYINGFDSLIRMLAKGKFPRFSNKDFATFVINNRARKDLTEPIFTKDDDEQVKENLKQLDLRILQGINLVFDQLDRNSQLNFNNPVLNQMHEFISIQQRNPDSIYFCYGTGQK